MGQEIFGFLLHSTARIGIVMFSLVILLSSVALGVGPSQSIDHNLDMGSRHAAQFVSIDLSELSYIVIGAMDFVPEGDTDGVFYMDGRKGYLSRIGVSTSNVCYSAAVRLPQGVTMNYFEVYGVDDNAGYLWWNYIYAKQFNYGMGGGDVPANMLASFTTSGWDSANVQSRLNSVNLDTQIDNTKYHYYIRVCPNKPEHLVYAFRVYYAK